MYCSVCGEKNVSQARFCKRCGSPLNCYDENIQQPVQSAPRVDGVGVSAPVAERRRGPVAFVAVALGICALVAVGIVAWFLFRHKPTTALPHKEAVALFNDGTQLVAGKEGSAHMRIRVPKDAEKVAIKNDAGAVVMTVDSVDMEDRGDGNLWADVEVKVPTSEPGAVRFTVSVGEEVRDAQNSQDPLDVQNDDGSTDSVFVPVLPETPPVPVPPKVEDAWVLADACNWIDATYKDRSSESYAPEEAGDALVAHLREDGRVRSAVRYGSTVVFCTADWALYAIALQPLADGMLGSSADHTLSSGGPSVEAFSHFQKGKTVEAGMGITAGNTATSGNVLLLNPTPSLMDKNSLSVVQDAGEQYASAMGGKATVAGGDEALPSVLRGEFYDKGVIDLRAHGLEVAESGTSFMLMASSFKDSQNTWDDIKLSTYNYLTSLEGASTVNVGTLFFGDAVVPDTWRCAIVAVASGEAGAWNVGISTTPNLLEWRYGQKPLDNCILWLSSCGSSADENFAQWALAHNAQLVVGYAHAVGQKEDADAFSGMLAGLSASPERLWRSANVGEMLDASIATVAAQSDQTTTDIAKGNQSFFALGKGDLAGRAVTKEGDPVANVQVEAWRYFGSSFLSVGKATTGSDGIFEYVGMPCGRYVVCVTHADKTSVYTVVVDEARVDTGDICVEVVDGESVEDVPAASVGAANTTIACDGDYYYLAEMQAISTSSADKTVQPVVVRMRRDDKSKCELVWQANFYSSLGYRCRLSIAKGRIVVTAPEYKYASSPVVLHTYSMNLDGSDVVPIACMDSSATYGTSFMIAQDRIVYVASYGDYNPSEWQIRMCSLRGENDELVCSVPNQVSSGLLTLVGEEDGYVFFAVSGAEEGGRRVQVYKSSTAKAGDEYQYVASSSGYGAFVVDGRAYVTESGEMVSYDTSGEQRSVVATLQDADTNCDIMNVNSRYAMVFATHWDKTQQVGGIWRIDLQTGNKERIYDYPEFNDCHLELIDNEIYGCMLGGDVFELGNGLQQLRRVWPPEDGVTLTFAQKTLLSNDELLAQARAQGMTILTGTINAHYEDWDVGRGNIISITLDEPIDFQYEYKGINDATAHEVGISSSNSTDYSCWATLTGKHVTLACEKLHGVYHSAAMRGTDATAIHPQYLF